MCYSLILFVILQNLRFLNLNSCSGNICSSMRAANAKWNSLPYRLSKLEGLYVNLAVITVHFGSRIIIYFL